MHSCWTNPSIISCIFNAETNQTYTSLTDSKMCTPLLNNWHITWKSVWVNDFIFKCSYWHFGFALMFFFCNSLLSKDNFLDTLKMSFWEWCHCQQNVIGVKKKTLVIQFMGIICLQWNHFIIYALQWTKMRKLLLTNIQLFFFTLFLYFYFS